MTFSILVCIKSVIEYAADEAPLLGQRWIDETERPRGMNLYDAHALEAALAMRDHDDTVRITALSAGADGVRATIRRAMAMGADTGVQLAVAEDALLFPERIAAAIADYARPQRFDLVLTGAMSEDAMQGITGPMVAAALGIPCAAAAVALRRRPEQGALTVICEMEAGMAATVRLSGPALVTVQTGRRVPRYPSLSNTLRARRQAIERIAVADVPFPQAAEPLGVAFPARAADCRILEGSPQQKADALLSLFNDKGWLR